MRPDEYIIHGYMQQSHVDAYVFKSKLSDDEIQMHH